MNPAVIYQFPSKGEPDDEIVDAEIVEDDDAPSAEVVPLSDFTPVGLAAGLVAVQAFMAQVDRVRRELEATGDFEALTKLRVVLGVMKADIADVDRETEDALVKLLPKKKTEIMSVGVVEKMAGTEWQRDGWDDRAVKNRIWEVAHGIDPESGEMTVSGSQAVWNAIDLTMAVRPSGGYRVTALREQLDIDPADIGERIDKRPTVKMPGITNFRGMGA